MPPQAYALPVDGTRPARIHDPRDLVRRFWDAIADTLVRTSAADLVGDTVFAGTEPQPLTGPADWLHDAERSEHGAKLVLRIEPPENDDESFRAVLQLRSGMDPSLLVDVEDVWNAPAAVLHCLGSAGGDRSAAGVAPWGAGLAAAGAVACGMRRRPTWRVEDAALEELVADGSGAGGRRDRGALAGRAVRR